MRWEQRAIGTTLKRQILGRCIWASDVCCRVPQSELYKSFSFVNIDGNTRYMIMGAPTNRQTQGRRKELAARLKSDGNHQIWHDPSWGHREAATPSWQKASRNVCLHLSATERGEISHYSGRRATEGVRSWRSNIWIVGGPTAGGGSTSSLSGVPKLWYQFHTRYVSYLHLKPSKVGK